MILLLRLGSLLFLWGHTWFYFHNLLNFEFLLGSFLLAWILPWALNLLKLRWSLSLAVVLIVPHLLRLLLVAISLSLSGPHPGPWDEIPFLIDKNFWPAALLLVLGSWLNGAYLTHKPFVVWERVLTVGLVGLVFWAQGFFQNAGEQPLVKALLTGGFMLCEAGILFLHFHQKNPGGADSVQGGFHPRERKPSGVLKKMSGLVLALLLLLVLFFQHQDSAILAGGGLLKPNLFDMDFSEVVELESEISLNEDLVLLYKEEGPPELRYLRRMILSGYSAEKGFFVDTPPDESFEERKVSNRGREILWDNPGFLDRTLVKQEYYLVNLDPSSVLTLNHPLRFLPHVKSESSSFKASFSVESQVSHALFWEPAEKPVFPQSEAWTAYYTRYGQDKKIEELAETLTRGLSTPYDKVYTIFLYLKNEFYYSLRPGVSADGRQLHHFLFESKKGYCTYFAYAMALMLRSQGIPSRVAVGFFTRPDRVLLNFYPVLGNQAHAWVEVWFDDRGWIQYDPTSSTPAPGEELPASDMDWSANLLNLVTEALQSTPELSPEGPDETEDDEEFSWPHALILWGLWTALVGLGYWVFYYGFFWGVRYGGNSAQAAVWSWSLLSRRLTAAGWKREPGESVENYWDRVGKREGVSEAWKSASALYLKVFYGPQEGEPSPQDIWSSFDRLQKSSVLRAPWIRRVWIFLVPFWPRRFL